MGTEDGLYDGDGQNWWVSYSDANIGLFDFNGKGYYVIDEDVEPTACVDELDWADRQGDTCQTYTDNAWCVNHGIATPAFIAHKQANVNPNVNTLNNPAVATGNFGQWSAIQMCCLCGGGIHASPTAAACSGTESA